MVVLSARPTLFGPDDVVRKVLEGLSDDDWYWIHGERKLTEAAALEVAKEISWHEFSNIRHLRRNGQTALNHIVQIADQFQDKVLLETIAWIHDLLEDGKDWTAEHLEQCGISARVIHAVCAVTRPVWGMVNDQNIKTLCKYGFELGQKIKQPYLDHGKELSLNEDAREFKPKDIDNNLVDAKGDYRTRYLILKGYLKAICFDEIKPASSIKIFMDNYVLDNRRDDALDGELLDVLIEIRKIPSGNLFALLRKECSEYPGGAAEFMVKHYAPQAVVCQPIEHVSRYPANKL